MSDERRAGLGAGRLQCVSTMQLTRVVSAGVLSLVALLMWMAAEPSAQRERRVVDSSTAARGTLPELRASRDVGNVPTSPTAMQSARLLVRHLLLARARGADGDGDTTLTPSLAPSRVEPFGDATHSARAHLQRYAQRHLPYGDPSSFDATAPPTRVQRNG